MAFSIRDMYDWAAQECQRTDVAYSQTYRNQQTVNGITYYDCSSFVFFACWLGGGLDVGALGFSTNLSDYHNGRANAWVVTSMVYTYLPQVAGFEFLDPKTVPWQEGDILAKTDVPRERRHTELCYTLPTRTMGAHNPTAGVSINSYNTGTDYYNILIRYTGSPGPTPPHPTNRMPFIILAAGLKGKRSFPQHIPDEWKVIE